MPTLTHRLRETLRQALNHLPSSDELIALLTDLDTRIGSYHVPIASAAVATGPPGQLPPVEAVGALAFFTYDGVDGAQKVYRVFKVPSSYTGSAAVHVHWTKTDDVDRSTQEVRWRLSYKVFNGSTEDGNGSATVVDADDTYDDNGTTTRIVHRTANVALSGVQAGYYVAIAVEKAAPGGTPVVDPGLVSVDFTFQGYATRTSAPA